MMKTAAMTNNKTAAALEAYEESCFCPITIITDKETYPFPVEVAGNYNAFIHAINEIMTADSTAFDCLPEMTDRRDPKDMCIYNYNLNHNLRERYTTIDYRKPPTRDEPLSPTLYEEDFDSLRSRIPPTSRVLRSAGELPLRGKRGRPGPHFFGGLYRP